MIYADFESILVPENNGNQSPDESYTNKYQSHATCSYGYKLLSVDGKFTMMINLVILSRHAEVNFQFS